MVVKVKSVELQHNLELFIKYKSIRKFKILFRLSLIFNFYQLKKNAKFNQVSKDKNFPALKVNKLKKKKRKRSL